MEPKVEGQREPKMTQVGLVQGSMMEVQAAFAKMGSEDFEVQGQPICPSRSHQLCQQEGHGQGKDGNAWALYHPDVQASEGVLLDGVLP